MSRRCCCEGEAPVHYCCELTTGTGTGTGTASIPDCLRVTLAGFAAGTGSDACDFCACWDGTYYLTRTYPEHASATAYCQWAATEVFECAQVCDQENITAKLYAEERDGEEVHILEVYIGGRESPFALWETVYETSPSCDEIGGVLSLVSNDDACSPGSCTVSIASEAACDAFDYIEGGGAFGACLCGGPEEFQVVLSGVVSGFCNACADINGTYILTRESACSQTWEATIDPAIDIGTNSNYCGPHDIIRLVATSGAQYSLTISIHCDIGLGYSTFIGSVAQATPFACRTIDGLEIAVAEYPAGQLCDVSNAKYTVTAL